MSRHFILSVAAVAIYLPLLLLADSPGLIPQVALGAATAGFLWLMTRRGTVDRRQIITAILIAGTGECVLSLGWGLYTYRNALIPLYVFFGHGVFYALAAESANQKTLQRLAPAITRGVLITGSVIAIASLVFFNDTWGLLWWVIAATLLLRSKNPLLLSACFIYTMPLEWAGTAIGNWVWAADVPFVGLTSANPPSGVGVLYILLDLITVLVSSGRFVNEIETARCVVSPLGSAVACAEPE
ncbi:MAG: hypothetical protein ACXW2P_12320 [Thermoanaerobaculia bacterium]